ncbi:MAG: glycosyltransferase family 39 protein [Calditrichaceae bacterium]|nr:glycosyltransferase family 39 protein [Calditrichaceae bacterium]RQV97380.1 MAG: hypothetical protein EH224_01525 [Calditrichota bacterium]
MNASLRTQLTAIPKNLWVFLLVLTLFRLIYVYFLPLTPQEAYYWYYAQYPDLSYFDHPPLTAYAIYIGTILFGNNAFGVKFMAVLFGLLTNIFLLLTISDALKWKDCYTKNQQNRLLWITTALFNLTIFAHLYAVLNVPDNGLLLFWILSMYFFQKILIDGKKRWWFLSGAAFGLGLLAKYTIVALIPAYLVILLVKKEYRHWLTTPYPYLGLLTAIFVSSPVVIWNYLHDWASFRFQFSGRADEAKSLRFNYFGQLIASQLFMLTPYLFILIPKAVVIFLKRRIYNTPALFTFLSGIFIIGGFLLISFTSLI